jgi:hypothetical protein
VIFDQSLANVVALHCDCKNVRFASRLNHGESERYKRHIAPIFRSDVSLDFTNLIIFVHGTYAQSRVAGDGSCSAWTPVRAPVSAR